MVLVYLSVVILDWLVFENSSSYFFNAVYLKGLPLNVWINATDWESNPLADDTTCNCFVVQNDLKPLRGEIYDDRGRLLISNFNVFDITVDGRMLQPKSYRKGQHTIVNDTIYCGGGRKFSRSANPAEIEKLVNELAYAFYQQFKDEFPKKISIIIKAVSKAIKEMRKCRFCNRHYIGKRVDNR